MYYDTIKKEIGKRLGDPLLDQHRALVGPTFAESVSRLIMDDDYRDTDFSMNASLAFPLYKKVAYNVTLSFPSHSQAEELPQDLFVNKRVTFATDYSNFIPSIPHYSPVLKEIDQNHQDRMAVETALKPQAFELYYIINEYHITFYPSSEWGSTMFIPVQMYYFLSPSNETWQSFNSQIVNGLNLETDVGISPQFIQKAINRAVQSLIGEEKGES